MSDLTRMKSWLALAKHYDEIKDVHMREMFEADAERFEKYSLQINDILYDYSKNRITDETMELLMQLARDADLSNKIEAMFDGEHINHTEDRAVLHTALRDNSSESIMVDGVDGFAQGCQFGSGGMGLFSRVRGHDHVLQSRHCRFACGTCAPLQAYSFPAYPIEDR